MPTNRGQRKLAYDPIVDPKTGYSYQLDFHEATEGTVYLSSGYGGGKTFALCMKMFDLMDCNRGMPGGLMVPTLKMYKRDVLPTMYDICRQNRVMFRYNKSDFQWLFPETGTTVWVFHGEDDGASIRGPNLAWGAINEITMCSEDAYEAFIARVRLGEARKPQIAMSGTPEGFDWAYDKFIANPKPNVRIIYGNAELNTHLHPSFFQNLKDQYDENTLRQYLKGEFLNRRGKRAAWSFVRAKHTLQGLKAETVENVKVDPNIPLIKQLIPVEVALDFNVDPMAATLLQRIPVATNQRTGERYHQIRVFDEIMIAGANTDLFCKVLKERLGIRESDNGPHDRVTIYPDPAGNARSTKSNFSDFDILRRHGFKQLKYCPVISVKDALNSLNNLFDKNMMMINASCRHTIADLEQCQLKDGAFEMDKSNLRRTHWIDGLKNFALHQYPVRRPSTREQQWR